MLPRGGALCFSTRTRSVTIVPGTASATEGSARRSTTPVGICQTRSRTRGSRTPGGSFKAFFMSTASRGPMPFSVSTGANRGVRSLGRMMPL